jgi:hypothetical protein
MATTNNIRVLQLINHYIDTTYHSGLTVSENLALAQAAAMNARKGSYDIDGRDAEYYLKARWLISKESSSIMKQLKATGGVGLSELYNFTKLVCICAGFEEWARTDPNVMVSPPGGTNWVQRGAYDGIRDDGGRIGKPSQATSLSLLVTH